MNLCSTFYHYILYLEVSNMTEKICRLCLQTIIKNYQKISESLLRTLKLNLNISNEIVICVECANYLQIFANFKTVGLHLKDSLSALSDPKNDVNLHPWKVETTNNLKSPMEIEPKCNFCAKTSKGKAFILLNKSSKYELLINMLKQHIPEMGLNNTEELLACEICLDALQSISCFISKCLEVEGRINKYTEIERIDDKGRIELMKVQRFAFDKNEFENRTSQIKNECTMIAEAKIKQDKEIECPELIIKTEDVLKDVFVKSERSDYESFQEPLVESKVFAEPLKMPVFLSETRCKKYVKSHVSTHKPTSNIKMFKCEKCSYETKHKHSLKSHLFTHKNLSTINMFKCEMCSYQTYHKDTLKRHLLTHKSTLEINMFKCKICSYGTNVKSHLERHKLNHKNCSEVNNFVCEMCSYKTKYKQCLKIHLLTHKSPAEVIMYKCYICQFETKHKDNLKKHLFIHKSPSEMTTFNCETCSYKAKSKSCLRKHELIHKCPSEINMFKCEMCPYEAKRKSYLKQHILTHRSILEVEMFKCELCSYETKYKHYLKYHIKRHESSSDTNMFSCEICSYETKYKRSFEVHLLTHETSDKT